MLRAGAATPSLRCAAGGSGRGQHMEPAAPSSAPHLPPRTPPTTRRAAVLGLGSSAAAAAAAAVATAAVALPGGSARAQPLDQPPLRTPPNFGANVIPALTLPQYLDRIADAAPRAWDEIEGNLGLGRYKLQSDLLVLPPFDDVRQACFFIPWVLLQTHGEDVALAAQERYLALKDAIMYFDDRLLAASRVQADEEEVAAAYGGVQAALAAFLEAVPPPLPPPQ